MGVCEVRIKIVKEFGGYRVGQQFDWGDGMARVLLARGLVQMVEDRDQETASLESRAERAIAPQGKKRQK
jgi:hypothetical protein